MRALILAVGISVVAAACASPVAASVPSASRVTPAPAVVLAADQAEITLDIAELI